MTHWNLPVTNREVPESVPSVILCHNLPQIFFTCLFLLFQSLLLLFWNQAVLFSLQTMTTTKWKSKHLWICYHIYDMVIWTLTCPTQVWEKKKTGAFQDSGSVFCHLMHKRFLYTHIWLGEWVHIFWNKSYDHNGSTTYEEEYKFRRMEYVPFKYTIIFHPKKST